MPNSESICPICGRGIPYLIDPKEYPYKIKGVYYCSYTCLCKAKLALQPRKEYNKPLSRG